MVSLEAIADKMNSSANSVLWGEIAAVSDSLIDVTNPGRQLAIGDRLTVQESGLEAEIILLSASTARAIPYELATGLKVGERVIFSPRRLPLPSPTWVGSVLDADAKLPDGSPAPRGSVKIPSEQSSGFRKSLGTRLNTGLSLTNTLLPICRGQRIGLFAGSGVGKSTMLADFAKTMQADYVVVGLIGERSREVREFVETVLGPKGMARSVVIYATSDDPPSVKLRAAQLAMQTAETLRDEGAHVLLMVDSLTRYADAHREVSVCAGEVPSLRGFPPSTFRMLAKYAERAGPGAIGSGDITAIFSILVAGSDMDEPVADMLRGILDGHIVLDRKIAERGRFPAINVSRSVSRSLPAAANESENNLLLATRRLIQAYEEAEPMITTGLYSSGTSQTIDQAIRAWPHLEDFSSNRDSNIDQSFLELRQIISASTSPL